MWLRLTPTRFPSFLWVIHLLKSWWKQWTPLPPLQKNRWLDYIHQFTYSLRGLAPQHRSLCILTALSGALTHCRLILNWLTTRTPTISENFCKSRPGLSSYLLKHQCFPNTFSCHRKGPAFQLSKMIPNSTLAQVLHKSAPLGLESPINW